jgi:hypothetical protein
VLYLSRGAAHTAAWIERQVQGDDAHELEVTWKDYGEHCMSFYSVFVSSVLTVVLGHRALHRAGAHWT